MEGGITCSPDGRVGGNLAIPETSQRMLPHRLKHRVAVSTQLERMPCEHGRRDHNEPPKHTWYGDPALDS